MKRIIYNILTASLVMVAAFSCKDDRNNFMVDDSFGFVNNIDRNDPDGYTPVANVSLINEKYSVAIAKSGKGLQAATIALGVSDVALAEYNALNGTDYVAVPKELYELTATRVTFAKSDIVKLVDITWDPAGLYALGNDKKYAIPVVLTAVDDYLSVDEKRSVILINPTSTSVTASAPADLPMSPSASRQAKIYQCPVVVDNPVKEMDITINYAVDESLIAAYNAANGTDYKPAPAGMYSLVAGSSTIAAGETATSIDLQLNSESLFNGNELKAVDKNKYLVPIRITSLSSDVIGLTGDVLYLPIELNKTLMGPWTVLEGAEFCLPNDPNPEPYDTSVFTVDKLFNGDWSIYNDWNSWWNTKNIFPLAFVADMGESHVFTNFRIADSASYQGQVRNYEIYTAEVYNGPNTQWNLVASGLRGYNWTGTWGTIYDYPVQKMLAGRYLKFVILNHERAESAWTGDFVNGRCKLAEVFGEGF